jgi:hypothetical protein
MVAFVNELEKGRDEQVIVLIPSGVPRRTRYAVLHNHMD